MLISTIEKEQEENTKEPMVPRLEGWEWYFGSLYGWVYNHPRFRDGEKIITSQVNTFNGFTATTLNTIYVLSRARLD